MYICRKVRDLLLTTMNRMQEKTTPKVANTTAYGHDMDCNDRDKDKDDHDDDDEGK